MSFSTTQGNDEVLAEINITPLVDVMLVLVVALIVTAPLLNNSIKVNLPKTVATQPSTPQKPVSISVDAQGVVYLDRTPIELSDLGPRLRGLHAGAPDTTVHLSSDESVNYGSVAKVMALIERSGITKVAVLTNAQ